MADKRILVTGAAGLLGGNLLCNLPVGWTAVGIVHESMLQPDQVRGISIVQADLTAVDAERLLSENGPFDAVVHTVAMTNVDKCEEQPDAARMLNVDLAVDWAAAAAKGGTLFVHLSTDQLFDGNGSNYDECIPASPINVYASTKLLAEQGIMRLCERHSIIRTNFFGFNVQDKYDLAGWIAHSLEAGKPLTLFNDVIFSPILVNHLAGYIFRIVENGWAGVINLAGSDSCSKYEFGVMLAGKLGRDTSLIKSGSVDEAGLKAARPHNMSLKVDKANQLFGSRLPRVIDGVQAYARLIEQGYQRNLKRLRK